MKNINGALGYFLCRCSSCGALYLFESKTKAQNRCKSVRDFGGAFDPENPGTCGGELERVTDTVLRDLLPSSLA